MASNSVLLLLCLLYTVTGKEEKILKPPVLDTRYGKLQGDVVYLEGYETPVFTFFNIPYAAPPVGDLRFRPPEPAAVWKGVRDGTKHGPACGQDIRYLEMLDPFAIPGERPNFHREFSEDCLHLDIYVPYSPQLSGTKAVMVFIHGGGFAVGSSKDYDGRALAVIGDVIVVVIQYRLGALGFLTTGEDSFPGNMGLKDQVAALEWVRDNIASFGGSPELVTIFGESAGSYSVSALMISPKGKGLFRRGIMQSGTILSDDSSTLPPEVVSQTTSHLAELLNCSSDIMGAVMSCLQKLPAEQLWAPPIDNPFELVWTTVLDGDFFPHAPEEILAEGNSQIQDADFLLGVCQSEGYLLSQFLVPNFMGDDLTLNTFKGMVAGQLIMKYPTKPGLVEELTTAIVEEYEQGKSLDDIRQAIVHFMGDSMQGLSTYQAALGFKYRGNGNVFFYEMAARPSFSSKPSWVQTDHMEDLVYTFGMPLLGNAFGAPFKFTETDKEISKMVISYWTNFANSGDPNSVDLPKWPNFNRGLAYIILKEEPDVAKHYNQKRFKFWTETIPGLVEKFGNGGTHTEL